MAGAAWPVLGLKGERQPAACVLDFEVRVVSCRLEAGMQWTATLRNGRPDRPISVRPGHRVCPTADANENDCDYAEYN